jgi:hypothetical protein
VVVVVLVLVVEVVVVMVMVVLRIPHNEFSFISYLPDDGFLLYRNMLR